MSSSPCNGCGKRSVGCHGKCDEYKKFSDECIEVRKAAHLDAMSWSEVTRCYRKSYKSKRIK